MPSHRVAGLWEVTAGGVTSTAGPVRSRPALATGRARSQRRAPTQSVSSTSICAPCGRGRRRVRGDLSARAGVGVGVEFDLFFADLPVDLLVLGHRLLAHPDPFHGNRLGPHDGALGVQHDLMLVSGADLPGHLVPDRAAGHGVDLGDRPADGFLLQADLLALHRHGDLLVLGDDVLAQPYPPDRQGLGPHPQLLLRAGHRAWPGIGPETSRLGGESVSSAAVRVPPSLGARPEGRGRPLPPRS